MENKILTLTLIGLLAIGWTFNPFLKKKSIGHLSSYQYLLINSILNTLMIIILFCYLYLRGSELLPNNNDWSYDQLLWILSASVITVATSILLISLIKNHKVSYIMPHIQPLVIAFTILSGYFLFKEDIEKGQIIGIILIILGLFAINYYKK